MPPLDREGLAAAVQRGRYEWSLHAVRRLAERGIAQVDVVRTVVQGTLIEEYPEDRPLPSGLLLSTTGSGAPLHVLAAFDAEAGKAYIVTAYVPDLEHFEADWRTRRK